MRGAAIACLRASFFRCSERELWSAALSSELLLAHRPHVGGYSGRLISAARLRSSVPRGVWRHEGNHLVDRCHLASANGNTESVLRWGRALALVRWLPCGEHICEHREYRHISRGTTNEGATAPAGGGRAGAAARAALRRRARIKGERRRGGAGRPRGARLGYVVVYNTVKVKTRRPEPPAARRTASRRRAASARASRRAAGSP